MKGRNVAPNSQTHPWLGAACLIGAGLAFALVNSATQYATMILGASSTAIAFWQYSIALLLFAPWLWRRRHALRDGLTPGQFLRVAAGAIGVQLWVAGLAHVPIWQAIALIMLSPVFVTLGAALILREPVGPGRWAALLLGGAGGAIILAPWSDAFTPYALLPVAAALFWAIASLLTKSLAASQSAESLTAYLLLLLLPVNALAGLGGGLDLSGGSLIALALGSGALVALAQWLVAAAYARADAAFLQPFDHVKLIFNVGLGLALFGFAPPGSLWLGAGLILAALTLLQNETAPALGEAAK